MAALLLSEKDIYERTTYWADFINFYSKSKDKHDILFENVESDEPENFESENNETSDENKFALVKVSQAPFEEREENEADNIVKLFSETLPEIMERRKKWVELGMDRVLDTFDTKKINENLEIYLRNSNLVKYNPAGCQPKRNKHPRQVRFISEKDCSSDESLESVDTAKYILSNRKHKKHGTSTMTFKTFRCIKSYQKLIEERYQSTTKSRYKSIIEDSLSCNAITKRFQSKNEQYFENDTSFQDKKKYPLMTLRERKTFKKRIKRKRPITYDSTFFDDLSTDSDATIGMRQNSKWKYISKKSNEKGSGAKGNLVPPSDISQWTSGCSADSESSFESKQSAICSRRKGCQVGSSSNSKFKANSTNQISQCNNYDSANGSPKIKNEEKNYASRRAFSKNKDSENKKSTICLSSKNDLKLPKISDFESAHEKENLKVSGNNCQGDQKNLIVSWKTFNMKNVDQEKPSSSIIDDKTNFADSEVITIISSDESVSAKEILKFSKNIETEVESKKAGKVNGLNKKALVISDSHCEKQLKDTNKYCEQKMNVVLQNKIAENPKSTQKYKNPKPEKDKKQVYGNDDISKNGNIPKNLLKKRASLKCAENLKVSNSKCQSNQKLNNEKKTNSFNKKAIIVSDSLCANILEDSDKYDEQEINTVFQNANTENSESKKDKYVMLKRIKTRIYSSETSSDELTIQRSPLKNVAPSSKKSPEKASDEKKNQMPITNCVFSDSQSEEETKPHNTSAQVGAKKSLLKNSSSLQAKQNNRVVKTCKLKSKKQQSKLMSPIKEADSLMTNSGASYLPIIDCNKMNEQPFSTSILHIEKSEKDDIFNGHDKSINHKVLLHIPQNPTNSEEIFFLTDEHLKSAIGSRIAEKFLKYNRNLVQRTFKASSTVYFQFTNDIDILEDTSDSEEDILEKFHKYGRVQESL